MMHSLRHGKKTQQAAHGQLKTLPLLQKQSPLKSQAIT
jgi:hypothetical protein